MKIALLTTDNREHDKEYGREVPYFGTAPEALLQGFAQLPDVEVHVLSCARVQMKSPEKLAPNIFFHHLLVPRKGWMASLYYGCSRAIRRKLVEIQPDIVHGQGTERDCAISAVRSGFPNVLTIHGNLRLITQVNGYKPFPFMWAAVKLETHSIRRSLGIVCITHYTQDAVAPWARKTWVLPNAVDGSFFDVNSEPAGGVPRILCVGLVCLRKNQNAFIRALDALAQHRKFEILFLGATQRGTTYEAEFFQLIKERPWCVYGGMAGREKLKQHFREAHALALPSREDNCPMVVLEAMAAGVPVMAAKVGGVPDLIEEGKTGFFCDPGNAQSMASGFEKLLDLTDSSRHELVNRAKAEALARFHPLKVARAHVEIYKEILAR